ncbi:tRNA (adenosine(37)-N6)-threonylcarbamoyltransferase complex dimerization subunit type 1 TsaB [Dehalobacterium formicoaceticum]|uniref:tRNA (adenosine(37)-N6)-threonylcarbamoyltransferase complex dimerization subunit type 1 TsaB n=1 Tax=Dehalobacterium formicoaceticum TaxID=51515 RepID=UPI0031F5FC94
MKILGIDAATKAAGVAIADETGVLAENWLNNGKTHSQSLLPLLDSLLKNANIPWADIQGIAVTIGPGSFTGLRIGLATVQGLAQVLDLPVAGVVTLDALAENLPGVPNLICPILDARKNEVYTAMYRYEAGRMTRLSPYQAVTPEKLVTELLVLKEKVTFLGDGVPVYQEFILDRMKERAVFAPASHNLLHGAQVALLGLSKFQRGQGTSIFEIKPFYLRPSEAEVKWVKTHGEVCL